MAYNRTQCSSEPTSADTHTCNGTRPAAAASPASNTHTLNSHPSNGIHFSPDDRWLLLHPSSRHRDLQGLSGPVDQTPGRQSHNLSLPDCKLPSQRADGSLQRVGVPISNNQQVLQDILRRHIGVDTAQLSQAPVPVAAARPPEQGPTVRSLTIPVCNPRISGSVDHSASRSSSGPELRSPERQYYRPMTGVTPRALPPPGRRQYHTASLEPTSASGAPVNLATDNNDSHENPMATNHSTYSSLREAYERVRLGFSPAYNGDPHLERNRSANVPNDLNCSLFLVNLPPDLTTTRLIAAVQAMGPTGRIYATHINAPEPERQHYGCAAKVIFFERQAAQAFFSLCEQYGFAVDSCAARVMWNRIKTAEQVHSRVTTRVLLIGGHRDFVNPETLTEYFRTKLQFQFDRIIPHTDGMDGENAVIEYRFGSFRCQAEAAKMALMREHQDVRCFFHPDPCDPSHPDWTEADLNRVRNGVGHLSTSLGAVPEDEEEQESDSLYQDYNSFGLR